MRMKFSWESIENTGETPHKEVIEGASSEQVESVQEVLVGVKQFPSFDAYLASLPDVKEEA